MPDGDAATQTFPSAVEVTGMQTRIDDFQIAPRIDHVARWIEFDERWSQACGVQIALVHVLTIQNQDVILGIDADSAKAAKRPTIRQGLWPREICLVLHGARLAPAGMQRPHTARTSGWRPQQPRWP
jgi:hypothetical protein